MWAVAAQPRVGLTPMIPTPSIDGADVILLRRPGLARGDGLNGQFDPGRLADEDAARFQTNVPREAEILSVDLSGRAEPDAFVAHGGRPATVDLVDTGHRDHPVAAGPQHVHRLIRHWCLLIRYLMTRPQ